MSSDHMYAHTCHDGEIRYERPCPVCDGYVDRYSPNAVEKAHKEIAALKALVLQGLAVVNDFMPSIRHCNLQDYARLNTFLVDAGKLEADKLEADKRFGQPHYEHITYEEIKG